MLALVWLATARAQAAEGNHRQRSGMIAYTLPEIHRLLTSLIRSRPADPGHVWSWSRSQR